MDDDKISGFHNGDYGIRITACSPLKVNWPCHLFSGWLLARLIL
jgi:hypothetical protein